MKKEHQQQVREGLLVNVNGLQIVFKKLGDTRKARLSFPVHHYEELTRYGTLLRPSANQHAAYQAGPFIVARVVWEFPKSVEWRVYYGDHEIFDTYQTLQEAKEGIAEFVNSAVRDELRSLTRAKDKKGAN